MVARNIEKMNMAVAEQPEVATNQIQICPKIEIKGDEDHQTVGAKIQSRAKIGLIDNNNNTDSSDAQNTENNMIITSSSQGNGFSIDEPRSLSTFAAASHIIVAPTMRTFNQEQSLKLLKFKRHHLSSQSENTSTNQTESIVVGSDHSTILASCQNGDESCNMNECNGYKDLNLRNKRQRQLTNKSESTTYNEFETSSMPSWVKNEFIQQQQLDCDADPKAASPSNSASLSPRNSGHDFDQDGLFQIDSSSTTEIEGTITSEISILPINDDDLSDQTRDEDEITVASHNKNSVEEMNRAKEPPNENDSNKSTQPPPSTSSSWSSISLDRGSASLKNPDRNSSVDAPVANSLKFSYFSKSQSDIRTNREDSIQEQRRNSIVFDKNDGTGKPGNNVREINYNGNLLNCDVYNNYQHRNSCLSSRSNSNHHLADQERTASKPLLELKDNGALIRISLGKDLNHNGFTASTLSFQELTVVERNDYHNFYNNNIGQSLATTTASNSTIIDLQQRQNNHVVLSKSVQFQQSHSPTLIKHQKSKTSASSSSMSNLRKSFLGKLFC